MKGLPAKFFGPPVDACLDAVSGVGVTGLILPPTELGSAVDGDRSVIQPYEVVPAFGHRPTSDPRRSAAKSQQLVLEIVLLRLITRFLTLFLVWITSKGCKGNNSVDYWQ